MNGFGEVIVVTLFALAIAGIGALTTFGVMSDIHHDNMIVRTEYSYFEGQKDYALGDIRVGNVNGCIMWTKSPWDDGREPKYSPKICNEPHKTLDN